MHYCQFRTLRASDTGDSAPTHQFFLQFSPKEMLMRNRVSRAQAPWWYRCEYLLQYLKVEQEYQQKSIYTFGLYEYKVVIS